MSKYLYAPYSYKNKQNINSINKIISNKYVILQLRKEGSR